MQQSRGDYALNMNDIWIPQKYGHQYPQLLWAVHLTSVPNADYVKMSVKDGTESWIIFLT